jgi:hypothetical protein
MMRRLITSIIAITRRIIGLTRCSTKSALAPLRP